MKQQVEIVEESSQLLGSSVDLDDDQMISLDGYNNEGLGIDEDDDVTFRIGDGVC